MPYKTFYIRSNTFNKSLVTDVKLSYKQLLDVVLS